MRTSLTRSCSCRSAFRACNASDNRLCRSCACCLYAMFTGQHSMYSTGWWGVNGSCVLLRIIFPTQRNAALPTSSQASIWFSNCELYICRLFCPELKSVLKFDSLLPGWLLLLLVIGMLFFSKFVLGCELSAAIVKAIPKLPTQLHQHKSSKAYRAK